MVFGLLSPKGYTPLFFSSIYADVYKIIVSLFMMVVVVVNVSTYLFIASKQTKTPGLAGRLEEAIIGWIKLKLNRSSWNRPESV